MDKSTNERLTAVNAAIASQLERIDGILKDITYEYRRLPAFMKEAGRGRDLQVDYKNIKDQALHLKDVYVNFRELTGQK